MSDSGASPDKDAQNKVEPVKTISQKMADPLNQHNAIKPVVTKDPSIKATEADAENLSTAGMISSVTAGQAKKIDPAKNRKKLRFLIILFAASAVVVAMFMLFVLPNINPGKYCYQNYCFAADFSKRAFTTGSDNGFLMEWYTTTNNLNDGDKDTIVSLSDGCFFQEGINDENDLKRELVNNGKTLSYANTVLSLFDWTTFNGRVAGEYKDKGTIDSPKRSVFFCSQDYQKTYYIMSSNLDDYDRLIKSFKELQ